MTTTEDILRGHPQVRRLLYHSQWKWAAEAAIAHFCHGTPPSYPRLIKTSTWKQIEDVHRKIVAGEITANSFKPTYDPDWITNLPPRPVEAGPIPGFWRTFLNWGIVGVRQTRSGPRYRWGYRPPTPGERWFLRIFALFSLMLFLALLLRAHYGPW
jgi:hypothetical protein